MEYIDDIKNHFFTEQNNSYLIKIVDKENNNESKSSIFQLQNNIFNNFMQSIYDKDIDINIIPLENIIISLNKMTIIAYKNIKLDDKNIIKLDDKNIIKLDDKNIIKVDDKNIIKVDDKNIIKVDENCSNKNNKNATNENLNSDNYQEDVNNKSPIEEKFVYHHIFSTDLDYKFEIKGKAKLLYFELYNDIYNIDETNYKFEIEESSRVKINIPFGSYNLEELLSRIENQINIHKNLSGNYRIIFNKNKNRIQIVNESGKNFNIFFIDSSNAFVLRNILGFSNIEYTNNNSYSSENSPYIEHYHDIYLKLSKISEIATNSENLSYSKHLRFDSIKTFGQNVNFQFDDDQFLTIDSNIEFYVRNRNKFQLLNKKLKFNLKFKLFN